MKNKKQVLIAVGAVVLITFIIIIILTTSKDKKETQNNMASIKNNYELLTKSVSKYNDIRSNYKEKSSVLLMNTYKDKHEEFTKLMEEYNSVITEIDNYIANINLRCNRLYPEIEINNICNGYKLTYEKIVNLYISDVNQYNNFITNYNEYKKEELPLIKLVHSDYIDYNEDKVYEGNNSNDKNEN